MATSSFRLRDVPDDVLGRIFNSAPSARARLSIGQEMKRRSGLQGQGSIRQGARQRIAQAGGFGQDLAQRNQGGLLNRLLGIFGPVPSPVPLGGGQPLPLPPQNEFSRSNLPSVFGPGTATFAPGFVPPNIPIIEQAQQQLTQPARRPFSRSNLPQAAIGKPKFTGSRRISRNNQVLGNL